jgi:Na+-driven multidrug efflux pump
MVFGIGLMLYGLFALYPEMLLKIFLPGEEKVVAVTLEFIDWFKLAFLFSGLNMALASFFTALHMAAASAAVRGTYSWCGQGRCGPYRRCGRRRIRGSPPTARPY